LTCLQGRQGVTALGGITNGINTSDALSQIQQKGQKYWNGAAWVNPQPNTTLGRWTKYQLLQCEHILNITNQSPSTTEVDIYYCLAKLTSGVISSAFDDWNNQSQGEAADNASTSRANINWPDGKPTDGKEFNIRWRVVKKITYKLHPGGEQECSLNFKPNRYIDNEHVRDNYTVRGITMQILVVCRGIPGSVGIGPDYENTTVSTVPSKVVFTSNIKYTAVMCNEYPKITETFRGINATANINPDNSPTANSIWTISDAAGTTVDNNRKSNFA